MVNKNRLLIKQKLFYTKRSLELGNSKVNFVFNFFKLLTCLSQSIKKKTIDLTIARRNN